MTYLFLHNYTPLTVTQFVEAKTDGGANLPARPVVLTFDDGFADFYTNALPVLRRYNFVATLYIVTAYIGATTRWLKREGESSRPTLNRSQLVEIAAAGVECGAHSHTHPQLDTLSLTAARDEVALSKRNLEVCLNRRVCTFAYPFGYYTSTERQLVRAVGYSSACAVKFRTSSITDDVFALSRLMVTADTDTDRLAAMLTGRTSPVETFFLQTRTTLWQFMRRWIAQLRSA